MNFIAAVVIFGFAFLKFANGECDSSHFTCRNGDCIPQEWLCDNVKDCSDNSDEDRCGTSTSTTTTTTTTTPTPSTTSAIPTTTAPCPADRFDCGNGRCTNLNYVCDGDDDCTNLKDEQNCTSCRGDSFDCRNGRCVRNSLKCNGNDDCGNSHDEAQRLCATTTSTTTTTTPTPSTTTAIPTTTARCSVGFFDCGNGRCISSSWTCDGDNDCGNTADELNCTSCDELRAFNCGNGRCVRNDLKCNGNDDCGNSQDEFFCTTTSSPTENVTETPEQRANRICRRVYPNADPLTSRDETCQVMCRGRQVKNGAPENFIQHVQKKNGLTCGDGKECLGGRCRRSSDVQHCRDEMPNGVKNMDDVSECRVRCRNGNDKKMVNMPDGDSCKSGSGNGVCKDGRCITGS